MKLINCLFLASALPYALAFSGRMSYFDVGLGSCGKYNVNSDYIVAVNHEQYQSSMCDRCVRLTRDGKSVNAIVRDLCPSCEYGMLDVSPAVFAALGNMDAGILQINWDFCDGSGGGGGNNNGGNQQKSPSPSPKPESPRVSPPTSPRVSPAAIVVPTTTLARSTTALRTTAAPTVVTTAVVAQPAPSSSAEVENKSAALPTAAAGGDPPVSNLPLNERTACYLASSNGQSNLKYAQAEIKYGNIHDVDVWTVDMIKDRYPH
ncbi:hypothetical protein HK098_006789 [Nowakowskiella sp. JEL0407]|nr:hypothetical protein HK098_006789 [Nowakowskiella sp. JEL0407]